MSKRGRLVGGGSSSSPLIKKQRLDSVDVSVDVVRLIPGLQNHGNTCYFNSALQLLFATKPISNFLLKYSLPPREEGNRFGARITADEKTLERAKKQRFFLNNLQQTFRSLSDYSRVNVPVKRLVTSFVQTAPDSFAAVGRQEDAHECFRQLLNNIHRTLREPAQLHSGETYQQQSIINDCFSGSLSNSIQCSCCGFKSISLETFLDLSIEIYGPSSSVVNDTAPPPLTPLPLSSTSTLTLTPNSLPSSQLPSSQNKTKSNNNNSSNSSSSGSKRSSFFSFSNITSFFSNISTSVTSTFTKNPTIPEKDIALESCLSHFFAVETMSGSNAYECVRCPQKQNGLKKMSIHDTGEMFCLHLKRFDGASGTSQGGRRRKLNRHVSFPLVDLDLSPYMMTRGERAPETHSETARKYSNESLHLYNLVGLIRHHGNTARSGHYVAYVLRDEQWFLCNDTSVTRVTPKEVQSQQAYVLVYQRQQQQPVQSDTTNTTSTTNTTDMNILRDDRDDLLCPIPSSNIEPLRYLSTYWIKKRGTLGRHMSGPPSNAAVLCRHGHLLARCRQQMDMATSLSSQPVVPLRLSTYNQLLLEEGYDATTAPNASPTLTLASVSEPCQECQIEGDKLQQRRLMESRYLDVLRSDFPVQSGKGVENQKRWYLLDTGWWRRWKEWYLNIRNVPLAEQTGREVWGMDEDVCGVLPPGPITNHVLLRSPDYNPNNPRLNLKNSMHYRGVTKEVWDFFVQHHGGGPEIMRCKFDLYDLPVSPPLFPSSPSSSPSSSSVSMSTTSALTLEKGRTC